jgi:hypothetical protein
MEKYFIVTEQSKLHKEYYEYKNSDKKLHKIVKEFMQKYEIETNGYAHRDQTFYIEPTEKDLEKFNKVLCKPLENGLRAFKATSKIAKNWVETVEQVKPVSKPYVGFCFKNCLGKIRSRLFDIDEVVYCSFSSEYEIDIPEGFTEIKASEFFKVIEDWESKSQSA